MAIFRNEKIKVNIISPLVCYGNGKPEIRSSSIRGAFRWWLRAIIGDIALAHRIENSMLGSTSNASKLRIKIQQPLPNTIKINAERPAWKHKLYYFNYYLQDKRAFEAGRSFDMLISLSEFDDKERDYEQYVYKLLEVFSIWGSFGARARRGYGSISLSYNGENKKISAALSPIDSIEELKKRINCIFSSKLMKGKDKGFYNLANASVYIGYNTNGNGFTSYDKAIEDVINKMKAARGKKRLSGYLNEIKPLIEDFLENDELSVTPSQILIESAAFGFPLSYQSRSLKNQYNFANRLVITPEHFERTASPLFIKIIMIDLQYYPLITYFKNDVIQNREKLKLGFNKYEGPSWDKRNERDFEVQSGLTINISGDGVPILVNSFLSNFEPIINGEK